MKRLFKSLFIVSLILMMCAPTALAANESYNYNMGNTGQVYNQLTLNYCPKIHLMEGWVNRVDSISFTDQDAYTSSTLGMAFTPCYREEFYINALPMWVRYAGRYYGGWSTNWINRNATSTIYPGMKGNYLLFARIDDLLSGTAHTRGAWNSDQT